MKRTKAQQRYHEHCNEHMETEKWVDDHDHPLSSNGNVFGVNPRTFTDGKEDGGFYIQVDEGKLYVWRPSENDDVWSFWQLQCGNLTPERLMEWANVLLLAAEHMIEVADGQS